MDFLFVQFHSTIKHYITFIGLISELIIVDNVILLNMLIPIRNNIFYKRY